MLKMHTCICRFSSSSLSSILTSLMSIFPYPYLPFLYPILLHFAQACVDAEVVSALPGFTREVTKKPFPSLTSHCDGYGGSQGPTAAQMTRVMLAAARPVEALADGVMQAVGGTALKADATFNCAGRIKVNLGEGQESLVKSVHIGKYDEGF